MGLERLEFGVRVRRFMVMSVKTCYRSVWNHPFLFGLVCFLIFLYRSFPLLFSILVTASPVLVCTAVLLGTLLSFGSPNIPEIDEKEEEKVSHEVSPLKTGATEDDTVVERDFADDDFVVERHVRKRWDIVENADEKVGLVDNEVSEDEEGDGSDLYKPLVDDDLDSRDIHCENGVVDEVEELLNDSFVEKKREIQEEMLGSGGMLSMGKATDNQYLLADEVGDRNLDVGDGKVTSDFSDVPRGDELDSSLVSSWKRIVGDDDNGDGCDEDDESLDSGSDGDESSSPDASMADIIPMLDELHPLLGSEAPQLAQLSCDGFDAASERSHGSSNHESVESDELENQGEGDNDDEEDEDEGEGAGAKGDKEDESKSAIKWTEDDQKNLMDLGTSELERNQRLENLIARRRARKSMRLMAEKNLIDLDSADIPLNIAPISTRRNPFDLPYDSYDDLQLPPIPGSAPSILQPRRNPFDLPYDSSEEKPDLKGDSFQEEFSDFNQREVSQREAFFRRHESFNVGPSSLGVSRQELKWKPYFVPERLVTEGVSRSSFQRQSSEVSESKLSSVPDSESVSSVVDEEDNKPNEQDVSQETELILNQDQASIHDEEESQSSEDVESVDVDLAENRDVHHDVVEITLGDGESQLEMESMSEAGATTHVELNASEIESTVLFGQAENTDVHHDVVEITLGDGESQLEMESNLSEAGATTHVQINASEIRPRTEPVEEDYSSRSSLSSLSEMDEKISDVKGEGSAGFEPRDHEIKESGISTHPSFEESVFHFTSRVVNDDQRREPVYDSSPPSVKKLLSFSSVSSDTQAEISEMGSPSLLVESTDKKPEVHGETAEQGTSSFQEMHAASSDLCNENEPRARDLPEISEHDVTYSGSSTVSSTSADHIVSMMPESVVEYVSRDAGSSSSDEGLEKDVPNKEESFTQNQVDLLSLGAESTLAVDRGMSEVLDSSPEEQKHQMHPNESSEAEPADRHVVDKEDSQSEQDEIHSSSSSEDSLIEGRVMPKEEVIQTECDQMHSSNSDASLGVNGHHDKAKELSSPALTYQHMPSNDASSSTSKESGHIVVAQIQQVHPSEANLREEHKKESEMDQVQSPCSDSKVDTGLDRDMNVGGIRSSSSYQDMPSRENTSSELKKQLSWCEKSTDDLLIDEHNKLEEPSIIATESRGEVNVVNNGINVHEVQDSEDKLSTSFSSMTSESTSAPAESPKHVMPTDQEFLRDKILNEVESEGPKEVSEHFNYADEVYAPHADEENISEEVDDIKEIDEGILSELDTIGDFNVREIGLLEESRVAYSESALLAKDIETETNVELPVLEARSVEDIDLAFKQLHEGVDLEEVILPSMIENQEDHAGINSKLPVVEARSLEDIRNAFQQGPEPNLAEQLHSTDLRNGSSEVEQHDVVCTKEIEVSDAVSGLQENSENAAVEPKNEYEVEDIKTETNVELLVLEARSVEDIDLAFKQLHEGGDVEEVILPSMIENQQDQADTNTKLPVVEARSLEDIHNAFQQGPESNPAELPNSSDLRNGPSEVERHDVVSTKEIEVSNAVSGIQENSENAAGEPKIEYEEASEKSNPNLKGRKAKSHDSSSSSSLSSSDSE
ncbi:uncharacterized protein LOC111276979 [Durio zibethinus]|uniref:Uncharacterized protein LOC111276979 n=1 Tax=Durio zibethinus TaxID=66656 RepID=A0A6P5WRK4_DURZI|nr:uncharacterized protein LOC111276979 [Durio zibethinus]XP_022718740.1 uncharacterized protein LOC111276979 [Durio zibethinus]XP_022718741.1 uncharacterized protein LOC111276979 [Durio zibethinus]